VLVQSTHDRFNSLVAEPSVLVFDARREGAKLAPVLAFEDFATQGGAALSALLGGHVLLDGALPADLAFALVGRVEALSDLG
jgi:hypothetical protein